MHDYFDVTKTYADQQTCNALEHLKPDEKPTVLENIIDFFAVSVVGSTIAVVTVVPLMFIGAVPLWLNWNWHVAPNLPLPELTFLQAVSVSFFTGFILSGVHFSVMFVKDKLGIRPKWGWMLGLSVMLTVVGWVLHIVQGWLS